MAINIEEAILKKRESDFGLKKPTSLEELDDYLDAVYHFVDEKSMVSFAKNWMQKSQISELVQKLNAGTSEREISLQNEVDFYKKQINQLIELKNEISEKFDEIDADRWYTPLEKYPSNNIEDFLGD